MSEILSLEDAVKALRDIARRGPAQVECKSVAGDCDMEFETTDGVKFVIFNDCGGMDYLSEMEMPDGRKGNFDSWEASGDPESCQNPLFSLFGEEMKDLERALDWEIVCGYHRV